MYSPKDDLESESTSQSSDESTNNDASHHTRHLCRSTHSSVGSPGAGCRSSRSSRSTATAATSTFGSAASTSGLSGGERAKNGAEVRVASTTVGNDGRSEREVRVSLAALRGKVGRHVRSKRHGVEAAELRVDVGRKRRDRALVGVLREVVGVDCCGDDLRSVKMGQN